MTIPATGTEWASGGYADIDSRFLERGGLVAALIRDYGGADTNISPDVFSPFAIDGTPRADMFVCTRVDGVWTLNNATNEGWWNFGAFEEKKGPERRPSSKHDDFMVLQSNWPFDSDLTSEGETVRFTAVETLKPLLKRIKNNLPLVDSNGSILVEDVGESGYGIGKPVEADAVERQLLLLRKRSKGGKTIYTCDGFPLVKLTDIGNAKKDKTDADAAELTFTVLPDPYFVDVDGTPLVHYTWVAGDGWTSMLPGS